MMEACFSALLSVQQEVRDVVAEHRSYHNFWISAPLAEVLYFGVQAGDVECAGICHDSNISRDNVVDALFKLVEEAVLVAQARVDFLLLDGVPGNVHLGQPVARDDVHVAGAHHARHGVRVVTRCTGDIADADRRFKMRHEASRGERNR